MWLRYVSLLVTCASVWVGISAAQAEVLFQDDFSGDLSAWVNKGGEWSIQDGHLRGYYNIGSGGPTNPQGDFLLKDQFQPRTEDWRMEVDFTYTNAGGTHYQAFARFNMWYDDSKKEKYAVGWSGWGWDGSPLNRSIYDREYWYPWKDGGQGVTVVREWNPKDWNRAALEKRGELYSLYLNRELVYTYEGSCLEGVPKLGLQVYGAVLLDNFTLVPEPGSLGLLSAGVLFVLAWAWRRRKRTA